MKRLDILAVAIMLTVLAGCSDSPVSTTVPEPVEPPFGGTIFIDRDILMPDAPTAFATLDAAGTGTRTMFDRRVNDWIEAEAYLFDVTFDDGLAVEIQVNREFDGASAEAEALKYAREIGRLPTALRRELQTVTIHRGVQPFGGGNHGILIHTGQSALYEADGILHETLLHEAVHTSLDPTHRASAVSNPAACSAASSRPVGPSSSTPSRTMRLTRSGNRSAYTCPMAVP